MIIPFGISPRTLLGAFALGLLVLVAGVLLASSMSGSDVPAVVSESVATRAPVARPIVSTPVAAVVAPPVVSGRWRAQEESLFGEDVPEQAPAGPGNIAPPVRPAGVGISSGIMPAPVASAPPAPGLSPVQPLLVVPPPPAIDPDLGVCAQGSGQGLEMWVVGLDSRVGVCFRQPVRTHGNVRLWTGDEMIGLTARSSELGTTVGGVGVLWFDRGYITGGFSVIDWLRDPELGDRVVTASSGEDVVYDLVDTVIDRIPESLVRPVARSGYGLSVLSASLATDLLVIGVDGMRVSDGRFMVELSDPFGGEGCEAGEGLRRAQALAGEDGLYSATFSGFMSACIARGLRYQEDSSFCSDCVACGLWGWGGDAGVGLIV